MRSQSGPGATRTFVSIPTSPLTELEPALFRALLLRRLRAPLPLAGRNCRCHRSLDPMADHLAACAPSGLLASRGAVLERACARMCHEAGARVQTNVMVRDVNLGPLAPGDGRRLEIVANGLPLWGGAQLAIDTTLISPIRRNGSAQPRADEENGVCLAKARRRKEITYPELVRGRRARLVVVGMEVGGRWSQEAQAFVQLLARAKARAAPPLLRAAVQRSWSHRWMTMLSVAAQRAFAASLLGLPVTGTINVDGNTPSVGEVLVDARWTDAPAISRMPLVPP